jgi:hypothetical protein
MKHLLTTIGLMLTMTLPAMAASSEIRVKFPDNRHCGAYTATYSKQIQGFAAYRISMKAGQKFEVHNMDEFVSLVDVMTPSGQKIGDFLMEPKEVKSIELPETGDYIIQLANDKDFYDLRFCAY